MAYEALGQLIRNLRSQPEREKITPEESGALISLFSGIVGRGLVCSGFAGAFAWNVARRLKFTQKAIVTTGSAYLGFVSYMELEGPKTVMSFFEHILGQDATRMQKELVNILVRNNQGEAWRLKLMSKHLYPESVYNDDKADKPQMRWRRRNIFTDAIFSSHDIDEAKLCSSYGDSPSTPNRSIPLRSYVTRTKTKVQHSTGTPTGGAGEDPFNCIFGCLEISENVQSPDNSARSSRVLTRKQRRAQRRRKIRNQEAAMGTPQYEHT